MKSLQVFLLMSFFRVSSQFITTCENPRNINLPGYRKKRASFLNSATIWPDAKIPYKKSGVIASDLFVSEAIAEIEAATCVQFLDVTSSSASTLGLSHTRTVVIVDNDGGCSSDVGKTGNSGDQFLFLDQSCVNGMSRTAVHEFLHALGYEHEFRRSDRDSYVTVNLNNVNTGLESQFVKTSAIERTKRFDISSVMQYTGASFAKPDTVTMTPVAPILYRSGRGRDNLSGFVRGNNVALSHRDKATLNQRYNCASSCSGASCQNGGYLDSSCTCQCPFGFTGSSCETLDTSGVSADCGAAELTAASGTIAPPQKNSGFKFKTKCIWKVEGLTSAHRVRVKLTKMDIDIDTTESRSDGACGHNGEVTDKDSLYVYLYGTDVEVFPVTCNSVDKAVYLNQWSITDTNKLVVYWNSNGAYTTFVPIPIPSFVDAESATNEGWSLDYEIGTLDSGGNFVVGNTASATTSATNAQTTTTETNSQATTSGTNAQATTSGTNSQATTSGTNSQVTTSGSNTQVTTSGTNTQVTTSVTSTQVTTSGTNTHVTTSGTNTQVTTSGTNTQVTTSGTNTKVTTSGTNKQVTTNGTNTEVTTSGTNSQVTTSGTNAQVTTSGTNAQVTSSGTNAQVTTSDTNTEVTTSGTNTQVTTSGTNGQTTTTTATTTPSTTTSGTNAQTTRSSVATTTVVSTTTVAQTTAYQTRMRLTNVDASGNLNDINSAESQALAASYIAGITPIMKAVNPSYLRTEVTAFDVVTIQRRRLLATGQSTVIVTATNYFASDVISTTGDIQSKLTAELEKRNNQIGSYSADPTSLEVLSGRCDGANCDQAPPSTYTVSMLLLMLAFQVLVRG